MGQALTGRRFAAAGIALAAAVSLVVAEFATLAHDLTTRHAYCPEHGEIVDIELAEIAAHLHEDEVEPRLAARPAEGHAEHDHCLAMLFVRVAAPASVSAGSAPVGPQTSRLPAVVSHDAVAPIPLLQVAPKGSPPRVG